MSAQQASNDAATSLPDLPDDADHFAVLGLPRRFDIAEGDINAAYRRMARKTHPDRFGGADPQIIARATRLSAVLNDAYHTVVDPVARAAYLLALAGGPGSDEVRDVPGNLLMDVMLLREQIEADKAANDGAGLRQHRAELMNHRTATSDRIAALAENIVEADDETKRALRLELNAIKYYDNLLTELAEDPLASGSD